MTVTAPAAKSPDKDFVPPHPGSHAMPRWDAGELIEAPTFSWRNALAMIGPGAWSIDALLYGRKQILPPKS